MTRFSLVTPTGLCLIAFWTNVPQALPQGFPTTMLVSDQTPRPDGGGYFSPHYPSTSGNTVVFNQGDLCGGCAPSDSIWAMDLDSKQLRKLVGAGTPVPGNTAVFGHFDSGPLVKNGMVVFIGFDANSRSGLYAVPAAGGAVVRLVDTSITVPGSASPLRPPNYFRSFGHNGFQHDGTTVVFTGTGAGTTGVYSVRLDGSSLTRIADSNTPVNSNTCNLFPVQTFSKPSISSGHFAFLGDTLSFDTVGFDALYTHALNRSATPVCAGPEPFAANSAQALPGNPGAHYLSRIDYGRMDGTALIYRAVESPSGFGGLFSVQTATAGATATRIADTGMQLPVFGNVAYLNNFTFAADGGNVVFHSRGLAGTATALFLATGGTIQRIAGAGDSADGGALAAVDPPGAGALEGSLVAFTGMGANLSRALYVAQPPADPAIAVTPSGMSLGAGQSYQFSASASNDLAAAFTWSVSPAIGAIDANGLYTAPISIDTPQTITITVTTTNAALGSRTGSAGITLVP